MRETIDKMHSMRKEDINQVAYDKLQELLECCTINLVAKLTGITRPTLYKWLDAEIAYEEMNHYHAAWFILVCETNPKVQMLLERGPVTHPRLAKRMLDNA